MPLKTRVCGCVIGASMFAGRVHANEATLPYQGQTLNANLELAVGKTVADGTILSTHTGLAHRGMELYGYLQDVRKLSTNFPLTDGHPIKSLRNLPRDRTHV